MPNNWDGQISAKIFYELMKKASELNKSGDDFSKISFKVWDNSDRKLQNPSYPDYTISFKIGDGNNGSWSSAISIWKSKPKDNISINSESDVESLLSDNNTNNTSTDNNIDNTDDSILSDENGENDNDLDNDEKKIKPEDLPF